MRWNYILLYFTCVSMYLLVLGILLLMIFSCSIFGIFEYYLDKWKIKSLFFITVYYLGSGLSYLYIIKGILYFKHESFFKNNKIMEDIFKP